MTVESEDFELKSEFSGTEKEWYRLIRTVVAMANTRGGRIEITNLAVPSKQLDSARIDDRVNRFVEPRVRGIRTELLLPDGCVVHVEKGLERPHIFAHEPSYKDSDGKTKSAFHKGQILVRHSSKTEAATADDLRLMISEAVGTWFEKLGSQIQIFGMKAATGAHSLPVAPSEGAALTLAFQDPNETFPFTTKSLAEKLSKSVNWTAKAAAVLGIRGNRLYCCPINGSSGNLAIIRYNEAAFRAIAGQLVEDPTFNPYSRDRSSPSMKP